MKRIIAILLIVATLLTTLSGCMAVKSNDAMTMGQWVTLIADSFGLQNYLEENLTVGCAVDTCSLVKRFAYRIEEAL